MNKILFINWKKYNDLNHIKIRDFIKYLNENDKVEFINKTNEDMKLFIKNNIEKKYIYIFPFYIYDKFGGDPYIYFYNDMIDMSSYIELIFNEYKNKIKSKFVFNSVDPVFGTIHTDYLKIVFKSQNIHLILNIENLDDMKIYRKEEYNYLTNTNLYFSGINYSYMSHPFNKNPINKICMVGDKRNNVYTERYLFDSYMSKYPEKYEYLPYDESLNSINFMKRLNNYICSFYSSHDIYHNSAILHKIFEILSSGSLLLVSYKDIKIMNLIKLEKNVHYIMLEKDEEIIKKIDYILNKENRENINKIRLSGQNYCTENLNAYFLYKKYINIIENI